MGVQTFAPHCQKAIGREQSEALICRSIDWLRAGGVTSLNFELMYGLPHQTQEDLADSLEYTKLLGADRIAVFGYAAVGFDHFALPSDPLAHAAQDGTLRRNFQGFTDDPSDVVIGMGALSISVFPGLIAQNEKNNGRYRMMASQGLLTASHGTRRTAKDRLRADVIEKLLCQSRAVLTPCLYARCRAALRPFLDRHLAEIHGTELSITPDGLPYARVMASLFDSYREAAPRHFSSAI